MILLFQLRRGSGGIGRRTRLRIWRLTAWGFKSLLPHQLYCTFKGAIFLPKIRCLKGTQLTINIAVMAFLLVYIKRSRSLTARLYVIINELELFN